MKDLYEIPAQLLKGRLYSSPAIMKKYDYTLRQTIHIPSIGLLSLITTMWQARVIRSYGGAAAVAPRNVVRYCT